MGKFIDCEVVVRPTKALAKKIAKELGTKDSKSIAEMLEEEEKEDEADIEGNKDNT